MRPTMDMGAHTLTTTSSASLAGALNLWIVLEHGVFTASVPKWEPRTSAAEPTRSPSMLLTMVMAALIPTTMSCAQRVGVVSKSVARDLLVLTDRALMTTVITRTSAAESTTLSRMLPMAALAAPTPTTITSAPPAAARSLWTVLVSGVTMVCVPLLELRYLEVGHLETKTQHWTPRTISISWTKTLT